MTNREIALKLSKRMKGFANKDSDGYIDGDEASEIAFFLTRWPDTDALVAALRNVTESLSEVRSQSKPHESNEGYWSVWRELADDRLRIARAALDAVEKGE